ncbi:aldose 1-epimerase family protein [Pediococcus argentinicus]|uniref:aldose 1-epimerase family protein n=1 Tax=Pediococcus argentinicus TaxID=480391 RepID=UPI00338FA600
MITIKSNRLTVEIDQLGAQVTHVVGSESEYDYIWNGQAWTRHAPILFPSIGKSNNDQYQLDGKTYSMSQHGFARDYQWENVKKADDQVLLELKANDKTKELFPFNFVLQVEYKVVENKLITLYRVTNADDKAMPFALGSHPGFNVPVDDDGVFEDYSLTFSPNQKEVQRLGVNPAPFRDGTKKPYEAVKNSELALNHEMFDDGLIIMDAKKIDSVILHSDQTAHSIKLDIKDFPYLTLWAMEHKTEPFLCIEPFAGLPDEASDTPTDWMNKKGNTILEPGESREFEYAMELN